MSHVLREATARDLPAMVDVIRRAFEEYRGRLDPPSSAHAETEEVLGRKLATARAAVIERDTRIVGCIFFREEPDRIYLSRLAVLPEFRRQGLGDALLAFAEEWARGRGLSRAYLGVRIVLHAQQNYYARRGYQVVGEAAHPGFTAPTYLIMEKTLRDERRM